MAWRSLPPDLAWFRTSGDLFKGREMISREHGIRHISTLIGTFLGAQAHGYTQANHPLSSYSVWGLRSQSTGSSSRCARIVEAPGSVPGAHLRGRSTLEQRFSTSDSVGRSCRLGGQLTVVVVSSQVSLRESGVRAAPQAPARRVTLPSLGCAPRSWPATRNRGSSGAGAGCTNPR